LANAFLPSKKVFLENSLDVLEMEIWNFYFEIFKSFLKTSRCFRRFHGSSGKSRALKDDFMMCFYWSGLRMMWICCGFEDVLIKFWCGFFEHFASICGMKSWEFWFTWETWYSSLTFIEISGWGWS
jgi:hypothetical protein